MLEAQNTKINKADYMGLYQFVPVVDGVFIQQSPVQALKEGKVNGVSPSAPIVLRLS